MTGVTWYERTLSPCTSRKMREGTEVATLRTEQPVFSAAAPTLDMIKAALQIALISPCRLAVVFVEVILFLRIKRGESRSLIKSRIQRVGRVLLARPVERQYEGQR